MSAANQPLPLDVLAAAAKADIELQGVARDVPMGKPPSKRREIIAAIPMAPLRYVTIELFAKQTGFTVEAVRRRRDRGVWTFFVVKDGTVFVDVEGYYEWVSAGHSD